MLQGPQPSTRTRKKPINTRNRAQTDYKKHTSTTKQQQQPKQQAQDDLLDLFGSFATTTTNNNNNNNPSNNINNNSKTETTQNQSPKQTNPWDRLCKFCLLAQHEPNKCFWFKPIHENK
eukprot:20606_1